MRDECLEELVTGLFPEARVLLKAFASAWERQEEPAMRVEDLLRVTGLTTHGVRKGLLGLRGAGLVRARPGYGGYVLTENGLRAIFFLSGVQR